MDDVTIARALHILAVVLWIGGVGFVMTVLLPAIRLFIAPNERLALFEAIERRFAWQARITTGLLLVSGKKQASRGRYRKLGYSLPRITILRHCISKQGSTDKIRSPGQGGEGGWGFISGTGPLGAELILGTANSTIGRRKGCITYQK
jgi:hypothetical protein